MVPVSQNIHWDTGSILSLANLRPRRSLITLDERPKYVWKPQIFRTVIGDWLDLQHGNYRRLFGRIGDAASLRLLIWNWRWLRCRPLCIMIDFFSIFFYQAQ
jgi:hypothetical protein